MRIKDRKPKPWSLVIKLIQEAFHSGPIPFQLSQSICVLIPKNEKGTFCGIGLLESIWKVITSIIHCRLVAGIILHDAHHGFQPCRGTGTVILETNLQMQLACCQGCLIFKSFSP